MTFHNDGYETKAQKALEEEPASYQLVGRVMAYQGYDG